MDLAEQLMQKWVLFALKLQVLEIDRKLRSLPHKLLERIESLEPHQGYQCKVVYLQAVRFALYNKIDQTLYEACHAREHLEPEQIIRLAFNYFSAGNYSADDQ